MDLLKYHTNGMSITNYQIKELFFYLDKYKPKSILELGSGVSTELLKDFLNENGGEIISIDHDLHYRGNYILELVSGGDYEIDGQIFNNTNYYNGFREFIADKKFDFVMIDGPYGWDTNQEYTRIQLLDIVENLADKSLVFVHDTDRKNAQSTLNLFEQKIKDRFKYTRLDSKPKDCEDCKRMTIYMIEKGEA